MAHSIREFDGQPVEFTSLDRPLLPGVTKADLLEYFMEHADLLLPSLRGRPVTLVRFPEGLEGPRIFQRHWDKGLPDFVRTIDIYSESNGGSRKFLLCEDRATLAWFAQVSAIELHPWHARVTPRGRYETEEALEKGSLNHPDRLVFDLDPPEDRFEWTLPVAELLHERYPRAHVKTSGKAGLHVVVPLDGKRSFDEVREEARQVGESFGDAVTMETKIADRPDRVYLDWSVNGRGRSLVAPYSPRGIASASASMPVEWDELPRVDPRKLGFAEVRRRKEKGQLSAWP